MSKYFSCLWTFSFFDSNFVYRSSRYWWKWLNCNLLNLCLARFISVFCFPLKYSWAFVTLRELWETCAMPKSISPDRFLDIMFLSLIIIFLSVVPRDEVLSVCIWLKMGTIEPKLCYNYGLLLPFNFLVGIVDLN